MLFQMNKEVRNFKYLGIDITSNRSNSNSNQGSYVIEATKRDNFGKQIYYSWQQRHEGKKTRSKLIIGAA